MDPENRFEYRRARGIAWVCDLADSTSYLNDDSSVEAMEQYLPRLHWLAERIARAAGGEFISWTGDGFLIWFEIPLHRSLPARAGVIMRSIWEFTVFANVTKLGVSGPAKFKLRHGVTYEQDALVSLMVDSDGKVTKDLIGRNIVLAFRLSGVSASFPQVVTHREIVEACKAAGPTFTIPPFVKRSFTKEERLMYFKGPRFGTGSIYVTSENERRGPSRGNFLNAAKRTLRLAEKKNSKPRNAEVLRMIDAFHSSIASGPGWTRDCAKTYNDWVINGLYGSLKSIVSILSKSDEERSETGCEE